MARYALPLFLIYMSLATQSIVAQQLQPDRVVGLCVDNKVNPGAIDFLRSIFRAQASVDLRPPLAYEFFQTSEELQFVRMYSLPYMEVNTVFRDYFILPITGSSIELISVNLSRFYDAMNRFYRCYHIGILQKKGDALILKSISLEKTVLIPSFIKDYGDSTYYAFDIRIDSDGPFPSELKLDDKVIHLY